MSNLKFTDPCRSLNAEYGGEVTYQRVYVAVAAGNISAKRTPGGTTWRIAEADLPGIVEFLGLRP